MSSNAANRSIKYNEIQQVLKNDYPVYVQDLEDVIVNKSIVVSLRKSRIIKLLVKFGFINKF